MDRAPGAQGPRLGRCGGRVAGKGHHEAQTRRPPAPRQRLWHHQVTPLPSPLPAHPSLHPPHLSCSRDVRAGGDSGPTSRPPRVGPGSRSEHVTWAATRCPWPPPIRKGHRTLGPLRFPRDSEPCGFSSQFRQWKQSQSHRSEPRARSDPSARCPDGHGSHSGPARKAWARSEG